MHGAWHSWKFLLINSIRAKFTANCQNDSPQVHQLSVSKRIFLWVSTYKQHTPPYCDLVVRVSYSPLGEYPAFQSNITACSFQADTHSSSYTVSWPRSQYKSSLFWKLQNSLIQRQHTPLLHRLLTAGTQWHALPLGGMQKGGWGPLPRSSLLCPDPSHPLAAETAVPPLMPSRAANNHKLQFSYNLHHADAPPTVGFQNHTR
jgi:hypothetical protein